jgi:hypothetical protein
MIQAISSASDVLNVGDNNEFKILICYIGSEIKKENKDQLKKIALNAISNNILLIFVDISDGRFNFQSILPSEVKILGRTETDKLAGIIISSFNDSFKKTKPQEKQQKPKLFYKLFFTNNIK